VLIVNALQKNARTAHLQKNVLIVLGMNVVVGLQLTQNWNQIQISGNNL